MRVIGMISGTSLRRDRGDRRRPRARRLDASSSTCWRTSRLRIRPSCTRRSRRSCLRRPRRSSRSAGSTRRSARASPRSPPSSPSDLRRPGGRRVLARPDGLPLGRGRPCARHASARAAGLHRRADRLDRRQRRPDPRHRRGRPRRAAREPRSTCSCSARIRTACAARSTSAASRTSTVVGPDREPIAFDIGPASALLDAVVSAAATAARPTTPTARRGPRARSTPGCSRAFLDEPYYALAAAEVDGQGALPPRVRPRPRRRPRDRARTTCWRP